GHHDRRQGQGAGTHAARHDPELRVRRGRSCHHGHGPVAGVGEGARSCGAPEGRDRPLGAERSVRGAVAGRAPRAQDPEEPRERERRRDRARPSHRGERRACAGDPALRHGGPRCAPRGGVPVHRRWPGHRHGGRARVARTPVAGAALFDIDGALLARDTAPPYMNHLPRPGHAPPRHLAGTLYYLFWYKLGLLDVRSALEVSMAFVRGKDEAAMVADCIGWYRDAVRPYVFPAMAAQVAAHREAGHVLAILTSATRYLAEPL